MSEPLPPAVLLRVFGCLNGILADNTDNRMTAALNRGIAFELELQLRAAGLIADADGSPPPSVAEPRSLSDPSPQPTQGDRDESPE